MMDKKRIRIQLLGLASLNGILMAETEGSDYWREWTAELTELLLQGGDELEAMYRADADTEEFAPVVIENGTDTQEFPAVVVYDAQGRAV